ncbi:hypothetical protein ScalyP_jg10759 [Parmales sp. scaly parma]|nr:hypothetical protein ScalyP_jg10759 [Parmales sp. scaly parma]
MSASSPSPGRPAVGSGVEWAPPNWSSSPLLGGIRISVSERRKDEVRDGELWKKKMPPVRAATAKNKIPSIRSKNHLEGSTAVSKKTSEFGGYAKQVIPSNNKKKN